MAERGHSCPQQRASYEIGSKSKRLRLSEVAADKNVRAPPAVTDRLQTGGRKSLEFCLKIPRANHFRFAESPSVTLAKMLLIARYEKIRLCQGCGRQHGNVLAR